MRSIVQFARDRRSLRRALTIECQVVSEEPFRLLGRRATDLSTAGMFVESVLAPTVGESVILSLKAPGTGIWIDATGRVARVSYGRRRFERFGFGLVFEEMDGVDRAILAGALARMTPPPVPQRPPRKDYAASVLAIATGFSPL